MNEYIVQYKIVSRFACMGWFSAFADGQSTPRLDLVSGSSVSLSYRGPHMMINNLLWRVFFFRIFISLKDNWRMFSLCCQRYPLPKLFIFFPLDRHLPTASIAHLYYKCSLSSVTLCKSIFDFIAWQLFADAIPASAGYLQGSCQFPSWCAFSLFSSLCAVGQLCVCKWTF